jgi:hypothetical protein
MSSDDVFGKNLAKLQPIRQLENNWSVDIAGELAEYIDELSNMHFEVDGIPDLDFSEAALVVYHSSCTYSKKVEHLYKLAMAALETAKAKSKSKHSRRKKVSMVQSLAARKQMKLFSGMQHRPMPAGSR